MPCSVPNADIGKDEVVSPGSFGYAAVHFWADPFHGVVVLLGLTAVGILALIARRRHSPDSRTGIRLVRAEDRPRLLRLWARLTAPKRATPRPPVLRVIRGRQTQESASHQQQLM
jgi:hypothetical protein